MVGKLRKKTIVSNVLKIGPITELEKSSVHGSPVEPTVELWLNR